MSLYTIDLFKTDEENFGSYPNIDKIPKRDGGLESCLRYFSYCYVNILYLPYLSRPWYLEGPIGDFNRGNNFCDGKPSPT